MEYHLIGRCESISVLLRNESGHLKRLHEDMFVEYAGVTSVYHQRVWSVSLTK
jgi:hypothetical protein